ncbi:hypothetical protein Aca07nite_25270 [Actinoplanes capillaceus]|uniref:Uncharacterized protein n=1 Tax=Actinoplanes campanulatus TaxID=113559 RepID=A0ABQ3WE05_9ACTN|nr:hypothetical protein Aca07nite_25270 [Actinoplanes capillaceus]
MDPGTGDGAATDEEEDVNGGPLPACGATSLETAGGQPNRRARPRKSAGTGSGRLRVAGSPRHGKRAAACVPEMGFGRWVRPEPHPPPG